jgi:hypothetical protein
MRHFHYLVSGLFLAISCFVPVAGAAIIYESGTLGPTGMTWTDLISGSVPNSIISPATFNGVRFYLDQPVLTEEIGGHFVAPVSGTFFGTVIALQNENDFPDSGDLSTVDVLGHTSLTFPTSSAEVFGNLELSLEPGWYALVFGSGLFSATAQGAAVRSGVDIGDPAYIGHQPGAGWFNLDTLPLNFDNHRFIIKGVIVPEPSMLRLSLLLLVGFRSLRPAK